MLSRSRVLILAGALALAALAAPLVARAVDLETAPGAQISTAGDKNPADGAFYRIIKLAFGTLHSGYTIVDPANPFPVGGGLTFPAAQIVTRPANTPTYAAGQIVCGVTVAPCLPLSWTLTGVASGKVRLTGFKLRKNSTGTTGANFRVHLYSAAPTLAGIVDAAAYSPLWADRAAAMGYADCTGPLANSDNVSWNCTFPNGSFLDVATDASGKLYAFLQAQGAYVGVSGEIFQADVIAQAMVN